MDLKTSTSRTLSIRASTNTEEQSSALVEENRRIREVYARRSEPGDGALDPFSLYQYHELLEALAIFFRRVGLPSLANLRMLDVGCGSGGMLWRLQVLGAQPPNCTGIDLLGERLLAAHRVSGAVGFVEGNAARLPFRDATFDVVFQFVVLTSVLDHEIRKVMTAAILRTLRPGGYFVSYDFRYSNPRNRNVRGIGRAEIRNLLPGCELKFQRLTLAPPIGRAMARVSPALCRILSALPLLRTHDLCFARKPELNCTAPESLATDVGLAGS